MIPIISILSSRKFRSGLYILAGSVSSVIPGNITASPLFSGAGQCTISRVSGTRSLLDVFNRRRYFSTACARQPFAIQPICFPSINTGMSNSFA
jgi:hypothetical protein